jgi:hypothetical protein
MNKVLSVIKFDKRDKKNEIVLLLFNEPEEINGKSKESKVKFYSFFVFLF